MSANGRVSSRLAHEIRFCCTAPGLELYWQQRYERSKHTARLVDNLGTIGASRGMPMDKATQVQKLRCGWLPVNDRESRSDPDRQSGCSACSPTNLTPETVDHVFQCRAPEGRRAIRDRFTSFESYFREMRTAEPILRALQNGAIACWIEGRQCPHMTH